ncbi:MAG: T9SS type A sorting domain-containing protein [Bacteroidetes bacterium]|nr:T9SS type A sorting domain-containing protein [Bacteroidota bacterium]
MTWAAANNGLVENSVRDMAMDGNKLFVLMNNDNGIYRTTDDGTTWQLMSNGLKTFKGFTFITKYNGQLFAGGLNGFYQTPTTSSNWVKSTLNQTVSYLFVDNKNYCAGGVDNFDETLVYYSNDSGTTWNSSRVMAFGFVNNFHKTGTRLLAGHQSSGVLISDDGGKSWTENNWGLNSAGSKNVWKLAETTNYLFAATHGSIYRAQKSVTPYKWQEVAFFNTDIYDMLVTQGDTIYVAPYGEGVYASSNDGDVWWTENDGLLDLNIISLAESGGSKIYCSSLSSGIYLRNKSTVTSVEKETSSIPNDVQLYQNYPNPFNPSTTIKFSVPSVETYHGTSLQHVVLKVYDLLGREVSTLVNEEKAPGNYEVKFNVETRSGESLPSGVYFYRLTAGSYSEVKKMVLLK